MENLNITQKPHKIFDTYVDNNLEDLTKYINNKYEELKAKNCDATTSKDFVYNPGDDWRSYNIFDFADKNIHNIYVGARDLTKKACEYYNVDFEKKNYYIHGWFNYWQGPVQRGSNPEEYHYHEHGDYEGAFHGYYCLNAEPSTTYYKINGSLFENINKNNRLVVARNGAPHAIGSWELQSPRITIAYNICPIEFIDPSATHYVPLA
jgi:hypothetical protein